MTKTEEEVLEIQDESWLSLVDGSCKTR